MYKPSRAGDPDVLVGSNKKSYEILKWKPKYNLVDMIKSDYLFRIKLLKKN
jgi:UDP-glucose 4-epimerase